MTAEILSVGTELLLGQIVNTDTQFLSRRLASIGVAVYHTQVVGDNLTRLEEALSLAMSRSDMVIMTGGLGPTDDDITKRVVASVADVPLVICREAETRIRDYMARTKREVNEANLRQAMLPKGCKVLLNDYGTAPGCIVNCDNKLIIMLPGPPRELEPMFINQVEPILAAQSRSVIVSKYLRIFGMSEAAVQEELADVFARSSPTVSPYAKNGEVELRITVAAETKEMAESIYLPVIYEIKSRLGSKVYTDRYESLQETVVKQLIENGQSVATAESCTGGLLSKRITEISGASQIFSLGLCTYSVEEKIKRLGVKRETVEKYGVVSHQVAAEMAEGVRLLSGASVGIGITGIAGPDTDERGTPVGTVYIALSDSISVYCREVHIGRGKNERELVRTVAASHALDMLRLFAQGEYEAIGTDLAVPQISHQTAEMRKNKKPSLWWRFKHFFLDFPKDSVGEKIRKSVLAVAMIALLVSLGMVGNYIYGLYESNKSLGKAVELEQLANNMTPEEEEAARKELAEMGLDDVNEVQKWTLELLKKNKDLVGKITIEDVMENYVTQSKNNQYYVKHDFFGNQNALGNPFLDYRCNKKELSKNSIIYGHSTRDVDMMFNKLQIYKNEGTVSKHPLISFNTNYEDYQWKIFAVMIANTDPARGEVFDYIEYDFSSDAEFEGYIANCRARSIWDIDVDVVASDKILTLSTCTFEIDDARLVIMARRVRDGESTASAPTVTKNEDCIYYKDWANKFGGNYIDTPTVSTVPITSQTSSDDSGFEIIPVGGDDLRAFNTAVYCKKDTKITFKLPYVNSLGAEVTFSRVERPDNGSATVYAAQNKIVYEPKEGFTGVDTFIVEVHDTSLTFASQATVTVYVGVEMTSGVTLDNSSAEVECKSGESVDIEIPVTLKGVGKLHYAVCEYEGLKVGTVEVNDGYITYTQTSEKTRRDTIKLIVCDGNKVGAAFTVTVNPNSQNPSSTEVSVKPSDTSSQNTSSRTSSAVTSKESSVSKAPVASKEPIASKEPVTSKEPIASEEPVTSEEPVASEEPVTSEEPTTSNESVASVESIVSEIPSEEPIV